MFKIGSVYEMVKFSFDRFSTNQAMFFGNRQPEAKVGDHFLILKEDILRKQYCYSFLHLESGCVSSCVFMGNPDRFLELKEEDIID